jgi:hypothetical protein
VNGAPALEEVRWLAREVIGEAIELPAPLLVSSHIRRNRVVSDYVIWWTSHPDAGSNFESKTRWTRWLPHALRWRLMVWLGYDGIVYPHGQDSIMGHVFFQRRGTALHAFSMAVNWQFGGGGHGAIFLLDFIAYASRLPGISRARAGRGTDSLFSRIKRLEEKLGWRVSDGWVTFSAGEKTSAERC